MDTSADVSSLMEKSAFNGDTAVEFVIMRGNYGHCYKNNGLPMKFSDPNKRDKLTRRLFTLIWVHQPTRLDKMTYADASVQ